MVEEALDAGVPLEEVFVLDPGPEEDEDFLGRLRGDGTPGGGGATPAGGAKPPRVTAVSTRVLKRLSDLPSTRGIAALAPPPHRSLASLSPLPPSKKSSSSSSLFLLLHGIQDPANVAAIVRRAAASGADGIVPTPGTAWPFPPRALRASAGSALRVPRLRVSLRPRPSPGRGPAVPSRRRRGARRNPPETAARVRPLVLVVDPRAGNFPELEAASTCVSRSSSRGTWSLSTPPSRRGCFLFVLSRR